MLANHARSQTAVRAVLYDQTKFLYALRQMYCIKDPISSSKVSIAVCTAVTNVRVLSGCFAHEVTFVFPMVDRISLQFSTMCNLLQLFSGRESCRI